MLQEGPWSVEFEVSVKRTVTLGSQNHATNLNGNLGADAGGVTAGWVKFCHLKIS